VSWGLITEDWRVKLLALGLAVLMLGAVAFSQNPPTTNHLTVGVSYTVPPNIILINPPTKQDVTYSGLADVISHVNASNLIATVDATRALPGAAVRLNVVARSLDPRVQVVQPPPIAVQVDTRQVREVPVQVAARAGPGWSLTKSAAICPGTVSPNPCKVHFDGPVLWETNLTATATLPGLVNVGTIDSPNQPVVLSNSTGIIDLTSCRTQPCVNLDVTSVNLHIEATPGASSSTVPLLDAPPSHGPPNGYRVTGITINPITVIINGDPAVLGKIRNLILPAVDLSSSTSDAQFQVQIPYPAGTSGSVAIATVTYSISRNPAVPPSP
jgi:YbbR-like protein